MYRNLCCKEEEEIIGGGVRGGWEGGKKRSWKYDYYMVLWICFMILSAFTIKSALQREGSEEGRVKYVYEIVLSLHFTITV